MIGRRDLTQVGINHNTSGVVSVALKIELLKVGGNTERSCISSKIGFHYKKA